MLHVLIFVPLSLAPLSHLPSLVLSTTNIDNVLFHLSRHVPCSLSMHLTAQGNGTQKSQTFSRKWQSHWLTSPMLKFDHNNRDSKNFPSEPHNTECPLSKRNQTINNIFKTHLIYSSMLKEKKHKERGIYLV